MQGTDRSESRDRVRQAHSSVDLGRSVVPMWDSSDPERAPPPLPLNPGLQSPTTRPNTSSAIAAAAQQIIERARESTPISSYTSNISAAGSPERSLVRGTHHKRLQSLQTSSVKDLRSYIDNNRSPEKSPERPASSNSLAMPTKDFVTSLVVERSATSTNLARDVSKDTPSLRPTARTSPRPILGENTPPSSTMLALQTMKVPDDLMIDPPIRASSPATPRLSSNYDFSSQLLNLTSIATNLQAEMAAISRRSKDNATDLLSLKEATLARDEDIRKGLRELSSNVTTHKLLGPPAPASKITRNASSDLGLFLDSKAASTPTKSKTWNLPRVSSVPNISEDAHVGSPSPFSIDSTASIAMLEKIIREMVTKDGQEHLLATLSSLFEKSFQETNQTASKVENLANLIKDKSAASALVQVSHSATGAPRLDLSVDTPITHVKASRLPLEEADQSINKEIFKLLQRIKDSISHAGGSTAEVKGLVRDMRGEVLGMGRELGKKLEQVSEAQLASTLDRSIEDSHGPTDSREIHHALREGLDNIKSHLSSMITQQTAERGLDKQMIASPSFDSEQIYSVVEHALANHHESMKQPDPQNSAMHREAILDAVKEGLSDFEPKIELQQFGLERDEILKVLQEGFDQHRPNTDGTLPSAIDKGEVYEVMQEALKDFQPDFSAKTIDSMRQDILADVREALLDFQATSSNVSFDSDATRVAIIEAVKDGVAEHASNAPRELEISREDLFDAVQASLDGSAIPFNNLGDKVLSRLQELVDGMHIEFKQYSTANGRDTEQVLDAVKDGLECLRSDIENYVDRAQDVTSKDEIISSVQSGLEQLRADVLLHSQTGPSGGANSAELLNYIKAEFEHLHATIGATPGQHNSDRSLEALNELKEGVNELHARSRTRSIGTDSSRETDLDSLRDEIDQLKAAILQGHATDKSELIETIQESLGTLHARFSGSEISEMSAGTAEELIRNMKHEFSQMRASLEASIDDGDRAGINTCIKQAINDLRDQLIAGQSDTSAEAIDAIKDELERFRSTMSGGDNTDHASLVAIREALEEVRETVNKRAGTVGISGELLEALRGEFESVRSSVGIQSGTNEEVVDTIRVGLDDLRSALEKKIDAPERREAQQSELLDVLSEGLETLRTDVLKTLDKPLDMTVNYEILDTLKEGLASLKGEIEVLRPAHARSGQVVLADGGVMTADTSRDINIDSNPPSQPSAQPLPTSIEVMLTQLQIKVEALSASMHDSMPGHSRSNNAEELVTKLDLESIETTLKDLQEAVLLVSDREAPVPSVVDGAASKADTDAIETLLRNTKGHLEDMIPAGSGAMATKEHLESLESVMSLSAEVMDSIKDKLEQTIASKADVAVVEILVQDSQKMLEEVKDKVESELLGDQRMTKADLDVLGILCTDIKTKLVALDGLVAGELPTKADVEQLTTLVSDFRESHDKLKDSYESDIAITARAFDDRKDEYENTVRSFDEVKTAIMEAKVELMVKLEEGDSGLNTLGETLKSIEDKAVGGAMALEVAEILETIKTEFEKTQLSLESFKVDHEHNANIALEKQGEHKDALVAELVDRLDTLFDGLMSKYDDAQTAAAENAKAQEERNASNELLFMSTKDMADDLRLSIDTLGTALTTFTATYPDTIEKMAADSKAVFNRVDDACNKIDETQSGLQHEHTVTREELLRVMGALQGVQNDMTEHNPRVMMTLREVQALITQHFEHSQKATEAASEHAKAVQDLQQTLKVGLEDAKGHSISQAEALKGALPALLPAPEESSRSMSGTYDDSAVHQKLDQLCDHMRSDGKSTAQIDRLDEMHAKLMETAAEVSAFVARQATNLDSGVVATSRGVEESALDLERRTLQRDQIEADIVVLDEEKDNLQAEVNTLKAERDALLAQKLRAATELSSVQTALEIRREELHAMENKAEAIEKRMLEGVMNQSRMLLLAKSTQLRSPAKKAPQGRDLRVASNTSSLSALTSSTMPPLQASQNLAFKTRPTLDRTVQPSTAAQRRIMSLSQINHNIPTGASAYQPSGLLATQGSFGLKRSHSVKTGVTRKPSWPGAGKKRSLSSFNKENEVLSEQDEEEEDEDFQSVTNQDDEHEEFESDAGTERRTSYSTSHDDENYSRLSYPHDERSYDGSSYMTGSELEGRESLGQASERSVHQNIMGSVVESEASLGAEREHAPLRLDAVTAMHKAFYTPASDSGIGTDLPTAVLSPGEHDGFFK